MKATAAGRAGGRAAPAARTWAGAGIRAALLAVLCCLGLLMPGLLTAPTARAAPAEAAPSDNTGADRPVQIDLGKLEPRALTPGATVVLTGRLTNRGTQPVSDLEIRLQRGYRITSRSALLAADRRPDPATAAIPLFQPLSGRLEPGDSMAFSYSIAAADLRIDQDGVYPVLLNLNGTVGGGERRRVGELATFLIQPPAAPARPTAVAWLWPITDRVHRNAAGGFTDDGLARSVASGGRLDRALSVIERLPMAPPAGGGKPVPSVPVTLAVDPALVQALTTMAAGPYAVAGTPGAGKGTDAAKQFLNRLRTVAADYPVVALPYGDVDADTLVTAGLSDVVTRSLAGTGAVPSSGAPPSSPATPSGAAGSAAPSGSPGTRSDTGAQILADALGTDPRTDLAWLPGPTVHPQTLKVLADGGITQVVLPSEAFTDPSAAVGLTGHLAAARTTVAGPGGSTTALVADHGLSQLAGQAAHVAGGARVAEQRFLAELATLTLQAPSTPGPGPTVLVAPSRGLDIHPQDGAALLADTAQQPWLRAASLQTLAGGPAGRAGELAAPAAALGLDGTGLTAVARAVAIRNDFAAAVVDPRALASYDAATERATSLSWRGHPAAFRAAARDLRSRLEKLQGQVTLVAPADGTYSLASSDAPLVLTVRNNLPFAVTVRLQLKTRGNVGLTLHDIGPQVLAPQSLTTLQVPTAVRQSGRFAVVATLTTPGGVALGNQVEIQVKSTAYGAITLGITIGAAALLALLFLRRLVRFLIRRRHGSRAEPALSGAEAEGASVAPPPTRSPV